IPPLPFPYHFPSLSSTAPRIMGSAPTQASHTTPTLVPPVVPILPPARPPTPAAAVAPLQQQPLQLPRQPVAPVAPAAAAAQTATSPHAVAASKQPAAAPAAQPFTPASGWAAAAAPKMSGSVPGSMPGSLPGSVPGTPGGGGSHTPPPHKTKRQPQPVSITIEHVNAPGLLEYGMHLLSRAGVAVPAAGEQKRRGRSFACYNACVSPVHIIAGWGVAGLSADAKTRDFIEKMIENKGTVASDHRLGNCNLVLQSLSLLIDELGFPSFIRLYIEPQFAIPHIFPIVDDINAAYGCDSDSPVIKALCFSCDDTGDATARKINHDVLTFTRNRVASVIDSNANLNRLAQACLVSVFATTFAWALQGSTARTRRSFGNHDFDAL
ncbi:hypothetical protein PMAYCL1PPCAC_13452, partial [Pristionchus mayeri]